MRAARKKFIVKKHNTDSSRDKFFDATPEIEAISYSPEIETQLTSASLSSTRKPTSGYKVIFVSLFIAFSLIAIDSKFISISTFYPKEKINQPQNYTPLVLGEVSKTPLYPNWEMSIYRLLPDGSKTRISSNLLYAPSINESSILKNKLEQAEYTIEFNTSIQNPQTKDYEARSTGDVSATLRIDGIELLNKSLSESENSQLLDFGSGLHEINLSVEKVFPNSKFDFIISPKQ